MRHARIRRGRPGFTMIELLVVILIIGILVGLLVPAIAGAVRQVRNAAVISEITQLSNALAQFKSKYGDYPPSRVILAENGFFNTGSATPLAGTGMADITQGQLAQRSVSVLRRFWPQMAVSTSGPVWPAASTQFYDFNGNGVMDAAYTLQGHECLVFFLGGVPAINPTGIGLTGFGKLPTNPFNNSQSRNSPFFEFQPSRLFLDPNGTSSIPGYLDSLGNSKPTGNGPPVNFYAYFSAYGNNNYDPNDVNFPEPDPSLAVNPVALAFNVGYPEFTNGGTANPAALSPSPNPYTASLTMGAAVVYQRPSTFQILSSGSDGLYGVGGLYQQSGGSTLPLDTTNAGVYNSSDGGLRTVERDNLTNFATSKLD